MKTKLSTWLSVSALVIALLTATSVAIAGPLAGPLGITQSTGGAPSVISYQGRVSISGTPFSGVGYFKFAVVDSAGATSFWSNNDTSSAGSEPSSAVALPVASGLFTVLLGDTALANMTQPLAAAAFRSPDRALRTWFSSDNITFTQLSPDTRLASVPYALQAQEAHNADYTTYPLMQAQSLNLTSVDADLRGFAGGFTDGRYGYFVPFSNGSVFGKVARVDLHNFTTSGITVLDLTTVDSGLKGFSGGFTDGRYGYFVPYLNTSASGKVARVDLQNFSIAGVTVLNLATVDSALAGFEGGFTDGRYGYFVPYNNGSYFGKVARVDLQNFTVGGVTVLDLTTVDSGLKGFLSGFSDGRYAYFAPSTNGGGVYSGKVARVDLHNFTAGGVTVLDLTSVESSLKGFYGGFTDGRYGYFVPYYSGAAHGKVARVDLQDFSTSGVEWIDLTSVDSALKGFQGGFTDGLYGYFVPFSTGSSGKIARIQLFSGTSGP